MGTKLFPQERRDQIINLLEREGRVSVVDLSERFDLSQASIRADLDALAGQGLLIRTHGGAIALDRTDLELSFEVRRRFHAVRKRRIGAAAAAMVEDGEAIALDASTTALALADQIKGHRELTVITNGLVVAMALLEASGLKEAAESYEQEEASPVSIREHIQKNIIVNALESAKGNVTLAAKMAGIPRSTFYKRLKKFKLTAGQL